MERVDRRLIVSASDLVGVLACDHLTVLDREVADDELAPPARHDPELQVLQERGLEHERLYLEILESQGLSVARIQPPNDHLDRFSALIERERDTFEAMQAG